jgi:hypothetical protein
VIYGVPIRSFSGTTATTDKHGHGEEKVVETVHIEAVIPSFHSIPIPSSETIWHGKMLQRLQSSLPRTKRRSTWTMNCHSQAPFNCLFAVRIPPPNETVSRTLRLPRMTAYCSSLTAISSDSFCANAARCIRCVQSSACCIISAYSLEPCFSMYRFGV